MANILVGCRLPNGLTITHPVSKQKVTIAGTYSSKIVKKDGSPAADYVTTEVDADIWDTWKKAYSDYGPLKSGAIFEARNRTEALDKAKELKNEKTGFEPMAQDALGVKKVDK